jgi:hypothetical protein
VADVGYCYRQDGSLVGDEPPEGEEIEGRLLGLVVRMLGEASVRVHLPNGEVSDLDKTDVIPAREATSKPVPVSSRHHMGDRARETDRRPQAAGLPAPEGS